MVAANEQLYNKHSQREAIEQAFATNRSASQLAKITTAIVLCTFVPLVLLDTRIIRSQRTEISRILGGFRAQCYLPLDLGAKRGEIADMVQKLKVFASV